MCVTQREWAWVREKVRHRKRRKTNKEREGKKTREKGATGRGVMVTT